MFQFLIKVGAVLQALIAVRAQFHFSKTYKGYSSKRLVGCTYKTNSKVYTHSLCSQYCNSDVVKCQSFNYLPVSETCELNNCTQNENITGSFASVVLQSHAESIHHQALVSAGDCYTRGDYSQYTCHPLGTKSCSPSSRTPDGIFSSRICNCFPFASGYDCSKVRECTDDGVCLKFQPTPASHSAAVSTCLNLNGFLATADSSEGSQRIRMLLERYYGSPDIYIGIKYYSNYADFAYVNNLQPLTGFSNWLVEKLASSRQPCIKADASNSYKWVDVDCAMSLPFICQVPQCPADHRAYNGSCYRFETELRPWTESQDRCVSRKSNLAWITYPEEESFVKGVFNSEIGTGYPFAHGLNQYETYQTYRWIHNGWSPLDFNNRLSAIGCFADDTTRNMLGLEGTDPLLTDNYQTRTNKLLKCYYVTRLQNLKYFALQYYGQCFGRENKAAGRFYNSLGTSSGCSGGEGGGYANDVYQIHNYNLYLDVNFKGGWNEGDPILGWWHGSSWLWEDYGRGDSFRSVCKIEICPQGFISYKNKCFKLVNKTMTRDDARDECQRFTGADLYNPEYSDENSFLYDVIIGSGMQGQLWVGIEDTNLDQSRIYSASKRKVQGNYNIYPFGADPVWRPVIDGANLLTNVEMRFTFPEDGAITGWEYYSEYSGRPLKFSVLRSQGQLQPGNCIFTIIGINSFTSGTGYTRVDVTTGEQIQFKKGDYIAMSFTSGSNIRFNEEASGINICGSTVYHPSSVGTTIGLYENWGRIYSFRALWMPVGLQSSSPYDLTRTDVFSGKRCFVADTASNMLVRNSLCNSSYPFICEIKKKNRFSTA